MQGNKVRKLAPVLRAALARSRPPILVSFGGAYSNHVAALATAGRLYGLPVYLFIRGEEVDNPVLRYAAGCGAILRKISRSEYRLKQEESWRGTQVQRILKESNGLRPAGHPPYGPADLLFIPEGGTTPAGIDHVAKIVPEITTQLGSPPDYLCVAAGTGGTAAGLLRTADPATTVEVYPALAGDWLRTEIEALLPHPPAADWHLVTDYAGRYGKYPAAWRTTSPGLAARANLGLPGLPPLEPIYTGKLFQGVLARLATGHYARGSQVVVVHTGGIY